MKLILRGDRGLELNFHGPLEHFFANFIILVKAESDLASRGWDLRVCITDKLPGATDAAELQSTLRVAREWTPLGIDSQDSRGKFQTNRNLIGLTVF